MGLFGGSTTYVSSVVYNMAGDITGRPSILKSAIVSNVVGNSRFSMSETLSSTYMNGPGINIRNWHRWCKMPGNYDLVGVPYSAVAGEADLVPDAIETHIPPSDSSHTSKAANVFYGSPDQHWWAEQFMLAYHYDQAITAWTSDYDPVANLITITLPSGGGTYTLTPTDYDPTAKYYYVVYMEQEISTGILGNPLGWIYKIGSGIPDIDSLVNYNVNTTDEFIAAIPIRIDNAFLSDTYMPDVYAQTSRAYKKLTKQRLPDLITKLQDNPNLGDIDHIFIVHGVAANSQEDAPKKYIVEFFDMMLGKAPTDNWALYEAYVSASTTYQTDYQNWVDGQNTWNDAHPGDPYPPPPLPPSEVAPTTSVQVSTDGDPGKKLDMIIKWDAIQKTTGTGLGKPGAKVEEVWWTDVSGSNASLWFQDTATSWTKYDVVGLLHRNLIYNGKAVEITISEALADTDESGFIFPLHYDTLKAMSLVDSTQLMVSSSYLVMNCYEVVKQKWYQTGIFKIAVFVAIIAITVATGGAGAVGLLGTAGSVGASLGFTGLMATIVGTIANTLAAMILMQLIQMGATKVFGAKIGAIVAAIATVVAMTVGTGLMNGMNMSQIWGNMMSAQNIIGMTSSVGNGVAGYIQASAQGIIQDTQKLLDDYSKESKQISDLFAQNFGYDRGQFDPMGLTDLFGNIMEPEDHFLLRTLMTGTDIAELSQDMLTNFSGYTITTDLPFGQ